MQRLREVLRYEYIGAIAIGFLLAQTIGAAINLILRPLQFFFFDRGQRQQSIFGPPQQIVFPWSSLLMSLITVLLYAAAVFILVYWLYMRDQQQAGSLNETTATNDISE